MNTKGIKFLAVLAVLAMAFAAFAVMTDTEQNSAAIPEEVTTVSTEEDFRAAITGDKEFNVKLGDDIVLNDHTLTGYLVKSAGVIDFNGYTVTVQEYLTAVDITDTTLKLIGADDGTKSVIVNESDGLILKDTSEKGKGGIIIADTDMTSAERTGMAVIFNLPGGVVTIESGIYKVDNGKIKDGESTAQTTHSYWYTIRNLGTMTINGGYIGGMNHIGNGGTASTINSGWEESEGEVVTLTINDGTIDFGLNAVKGSTLSYVLVNGGILKDSLSCSVMSWDKVTINDATLKGKNAGLSINRVPNTETSRGEMTINTDLTFDGSSNIGYGSEGWNGGATLIVNGTITTSGDITCADGVITGNGQIKTTGKLKVDPGYNFCLAGDQKLTILEGATVPADVVFAYVDEYNDTHSFMTDVALDVGIGDFTIAAGQNKLTVDGTVTLTEATTYTCEGNVTLSGMVYKDAEFEPTADTADLTLENVTKDRSGSAAPADIKLGTFQITDGGSVAIATSVLVEAGCSFYVSGDMTIADGAVLKIAEGSIVKPEGKLLVTAPKEATATDSATVGGSIWNAGKMIATNYDDGTNVFDKQLVRVFMNTGYQTGTYYLGSSVYDGTVTYGPDANNGAQSPLTVAFGSYIDMTGIDKVNLTSGGIDVNSALYKYKTLILATFDNTIALTATYDNQYSVTVSLDGKSAATPVKTAKSATINNVVWQSPISATLYVTAPEVYTVVLAKVIDEDADPVTSTTPWTSGFTIKDQNGRAIPIAADGTIKVVFGYQYTIEGANSTSNYKFFSPNGELTDLTKVDKTKGTFTMIRNNVYDDNNKETPVVLYITEGYAVELTVYLDDKDKKYSVGDVFMHYNVANDEGKVVGDGTPVTVELDKDEKKVGIITGIYSNDTIYFKSEFVKFFKSTAIAEGAKKIVFPYTETEIVVDPVTQEETEVPVYEDVVLSSKKYEQAFTFTGITKKENKASFTLKSDLDTVNVTFTFGQYESETEYIDEDQKITVNFTTYCDELEHSDSISRTLSETMESQDPGMFVITMAVGEVYTVSWTDITGYLSTMTYEKAVVEPGEDAEVKEYEQKTSVTVSEALDYTLSEEELYYITVENQTNYDLTITIGEFTADVKAKKSNNKVVANDGDTNPAILSKKGYTVNDWKFQTKQGDAVAPEVYVSGTMTVKDLVKASNPSDPIKPEEDGYFDPIPTDGSAYSYTLIITETHVQIITYTVDVEADDHAKITNYDNSGQLGQPRKAYVQPYAEYTVIGVEYEYQEVGMTEKAVGQAVKKTSETTGQEYWEYIMPASNVVLKPISQKETRNLSFVDENGEPIEDATKVEPTTQVNMPVPCKPLSEIVSVTTESQIDYVYDPVTGYISFEMPDEDVVFVVTCVEIEYSDDVTIFLEKAQGGVKVTLLANDGVCIQAGSVEFTYYYAYELNGKWATGFKTYTAQTGEIDDKVLFQFTVDLSEQERFAETMWIEGTYTSSDEAVNAASELIVYQ